MGSPSLSEPGGGTGLGGLEPHRVVCGCACHPVRCHYCRLSCQCQRSVTDDTLLSVDIVPVLL